MSYAGAEGLQGAVFGALAGDAVLTALVGGHIYDAVPGGTVPPLYVTLGAETVRDRSDKSAAGAEHVFTVSVVTDAAGFRHAKAAAGAISDILHRADLPLARGTLTSLDFLKATARREGAGELRRVDLKFRARVDEI